MCCRLFMIIESRCVLQSKHMVVMTLAFSAGMTVGPALGGVSFLQTLKS